MTGITINISEEVKALSERFEQFPAVFQREAEPVMYASMEVLHENVPPYPTVPNPTRTGTLGRTLGASMEGGALGRPQVFEVKQLGTGFTGTFGTNLDYAPYVIGDDTQAWMHYRWWTMKDIAQAATGKIIELWTSLMDDLAAWLKG